MARKLSSGASSCSAGPNSKQPFGVPHVFLRAGLKSSCIFCAFVFFNSIESSVVPLAYRTLVLLKYFFPYTLIYKVDFRYLMQTIMVFKGFYRMT